MRDVVHSSSVRIPSNAPFPARSRSISEKASLAAFSATRRAARSSLPRRAWYSCRHRRFSPAVLSASRRGSFAIARLASCHVAVADTSASASAARNASSASALVAYATGEGKDVDLDVDLDADLDADLAAAFATAAFAAAAPSAARASLPRDAELVREGPSGLLRVEMMVVGAPVRGGSLLPPGRGVRALGGGHQLEGFLVRGLARHRVVPVLASAVGSDVFGPHPAADGRDARGGGGMAEAGGAGKAPGGAEPGADVIHAGSVDARPRPDMPARETRTPRPGSRDPPTARAREWRTIQDVDQVVPVLVIVVVVFTRRISTRHDDFGCFVQMCIQLETLSTPQWARRAARPPTRPTTARVAPPSPPPRPPSSPPPRPASPAPPPTP